MLNNIFTTMGGIFTGMASHFYLKGTGSFFFSLFVFAFGLNNVVVIQGLLFLILIDSITGVYAAWTTKEVITSRKMLRSAFKVVVYGILLASSHVVEVVLPGTLFIEEIVSSFLALTEFISIIENAGKMGYGIPKQLLKKLQKLRDSK